MATTEATKQRRALQVLWSELDRYAYPCLKDGLVLAVSGGPDSRALLEACATWSKRHHGQIVVATLDHQARRESAAESQFITMRAKRLGFLATAEAMVNLDHKLAEHDLRFGRYQALTRIARQYQCQTIVTAHHADDDAEGYFLALMGQGGGELGASMHVHSTKNGLTLCRPFLALKKQDLLNALTLLGVTDFVEDSLDAQGAGARAHVRNFIFPGLFKRLPSLSRGLVNSGRRQAQQKELIDNLAVGKVNYVGDEAIIDLEHPTDKALIIAALWQVLKKWSNNKDLRASQATIDAMVDEIPAVFFPRLDPNANAFNLRDLSAKQYHFPGVIVTKGLKNIVIRRI